MTGRTAAPHHPKAAQAEAGSRVFTADLDGRITHVGDALLHIGGHSEQDMLGEPLSGLLHAEMPECIFAETGRKLRNGEEVFAFVVFRAGDGGGCWQLAHFSPTCDGRGQVGGYRAVCREAQTEEIAQIEPFYRKIRKLERASAQARDTGCEAAA